MRRKISFLFDRLFHRDRLDSDINEEIAFHVAQRAQELERQGIGAADALRRARLEFGAAEKYKEQCRETRRLQLLHDLASDVRFGGRMLRKSPGFTSVVLLTLTLGIGANTTMFSLLDALVWRNLPAPEPQQLVHFGASAPNESYVALSFPMFEEISRRQTVFSSTFAWWGGAVMNVEANGSLVRSEIDAVTGNFYSELGGTPEIGRLIAPQDAALDHEAIQVAVLGYGFWKRYYGGDRSIVGQTIKVEGVPFTVIGVSRNDFRGTSSDVPSEITLPITAEPLLNGHSDWREHLQRKTSLWLDAAGRLKPGVTIAQSRAQLQALWPTVREDMSSPSESSAQQAALRHLRLMVESLATGDSLVRGKFQQPVTVLLVISGLVLLLACVNLAGLMLARASVRRHELAIRVSLGATQGRLLRQMLTESLLLAILGSASGFIFALWGSRAISDFVLRTIYIIPASLELAPDPRVLGFTAIVAIATGILFGLVPAWSAACENPNVGLQQGSRTLGHASGFLGKSLVVAQISISLVLLAGAGLFIRSLDKLRMVQPGFQIANVLSIELFPKPNGYKDLAWVSYYHDLTDRISRLPGVDAAGLVHTRIGNIIEWVETVRDHGSTGSGQAVDCQMVMPGLFSTIQIKLLRGRDFTWEDDDRSTHVAIVSEKFANKVFPSGDAIGRRVEMTTEPKWKEMEIVGIVSDATLYDIRKPAPPTIYLPSMQYGDYMGWSEVMVRTSLPPQPVIDSVRSTVNSLGHEYVPAAVTESQEIERSILRERVTGMLSGVLAVLALLIAGISLYGLMAYNVNRRTREIGIRVTLGAQPGGIQWMILRETLALVLVGIAMGLPLTWLGTRLIAHMIFGLSPHDPTTTAITIAILTLAGLLAAILPARRAMRVDPIVVLRSE